MPDRHRFPLARGSRFYWGAGTETTKGRQVEVFDLGLIPESLTTTGPVPSAALGPPYYSPYPWNNELSLYILISLQLQSL